MKKSFIHYPSHLLCKGDVVYDENQHLLLKLDFITRSGLPIFVVIGNERGYSVEYAPTRIMPDTYSDNINHLQYVCKFSFITRVKNLFRIYHLLPNTRLGIFLRNFSPFCSRQE